MLERRAAEGRRLRAANQQRSSRRRLCRGAVDHRVPGAAQHVGLFDRKARPTAARRCWRSPCSAWGSTSSLTACSLLGRDTGVDRRMRRKPSRCVGRSNASRDLGAVLTLDDCNVVLALQVEPELCTVPEIVAEPNCCIGGNRPATVQYIGNAARWYPEVECKPVCAERAPSAHASASARGVLQTAWTSPYGNRRSRHRTHRPS